MKGFLLVGAPKKKGFLSSDEEPAKAKPWGGAEDDKAEDTEGGNKVEQMAEAALKDPAALVALIDARIRACMAKTDETDE